MRSTYKKPLALLLSAALSFTLSGSPVYASNSSLLPETGTGSLQTNRCPEPLQNF